MRLKRFSIIALLLLLSFQILGGTSFAASIKKLPLLNKVSLHKATSSGFFKQNQSTSISFFDLFDSENKDDNEDDHISQFFELNDFIHTESIHYSYFPVFSRENKHFLVHIQTSIKERRPDLCVLYCQFLI